MITFKKVLLFFLIFSCNVFSNTIEEQIKKISSSVMQKEIPKIEREFNVSIYAINLTEKSVNDYPEFAGGGVPAKVKSIYNQIQDGGNPSVSISGYSSTKITRGGQTFLIIYPKVEKPVVEKQEVEFKIHSNVKDFVLKIDGIGTKNVKGNQFLGKISADKLPISYTIKKEGYETVIGKITNNKKDININFIAIKSVENEIKKQPKVEEIKKEIPVEKQEEQKKVNVEENTDKNTDIINTKPIITQQPKEPIKETSDFSNITIFGICSIVILFLGFIFI